MSLSLIVIFGSVLANSPGLVSLHRSVVPENGRSAGRGMSAFAEHHREERSNVLEERNMIRRGAAAGGKNASG